RALGVIGSHHREGVVTDLCRHLAPQGVGAVAIGVNPSGGVESITDERGNLNGTVRKQAWVDELCDVGGSRPSGQVVDRCEAVGLAATEGGSGPQDPVLSCHAFRPSNTTEGLGEKGLQTGGRVGLSKECPRVAVNRIMLGV